MVNLQALLSRLARYVQDCGIARDVSDVHNSKTQAASPYLEAKLCGDPGERLKVREGLHHEPCRCSLATRICGRSLVPPRSDVNEQHRKRPQCRPKYSPNHLIRPAYGQHCRPYIARAVHGSLSKVEVQHPYVIGGSSNS